MPVVISGTTGIVTPALTSNGLTTMTGRSTVGTNLTVSGNTTFGGAGKVSNTTGWFGVNGRQSISTNLFVGGNTNLGAANKTITATGLLAVTGRATISTNLAVSGNASVTGAVSGASSISDTNGNVRSVPQNSQSGAYALLATDAGKHISITTGGITVNQNIFAIGDAVSIFNNSGSSQTITQGTGVTLRLVGTATTGNRTLAQYGLATILCVASNVFVVIGVT